MDSPGPTRRRDRSYELLWVTRLAVEGMCIRGRPIRSLTTTETFCFDTRKQTTGKKSRLSRKLLQTMASRDTEKSFESVGADGVRRLFALSQLRNTLGGQTVLRSSISQLSRHSTRRILLAATNLLGQFQLWRWGPHGLVPTFSFFAESETSLRRQRRSLPVTSVREPSCPMSGASSDRWRALLTILRRRWSNVKPKPPYRNIRLTTTTAAKNSL